MMRTKLYEEQVRKQEEEKLRTLPPSDLLEYRREEKKFDQKKVELSAKSSME